ncbi:hypothetical protein BaRGS_00028669 [Batillaria attramentaria]|uniref:Uncharacterized protein n=1 Tax=Batillaria attramentaria TaxID=370345 RepID=A0ABD0JYP7_9CAEN
MDQQACLSGQAASHDGKSATEAGNYKYTVVLPGRAKLLSTADAPNCRLAWQQAFASQLTLAAPVGSGLAYIRLSPVSLPSAAQNKVCQRMGEVASRSELFRRLL